MTFKVLFQDIKKLETEALIVGFHEDVRPLKGLAGELDWLLCGSLSALVIERKLTGALGDAALLTSRGKVPAAKIFLVGLGPREGATAAAVSRAAMTAISTVLNAGVRKAVLECFPGFSLPCDARVPALCRGVSEGAAGRNVDVTILADDAAAYETISRLVRA